MNVLEIGAAICVEGTFVGVSKVLMSDYVDGTLQSLLSDGYISIRVKGLLQDETTFYYIRRFLNKQIPLSVVHAPQWYVAPRTSVLNRLRSFF